MKQIDKFSHWGRWYQKEVARIVDSTEGVKNIRVSRFPWRDEADRCSTNRLARNRSRIHPIKEVTHSHIEPHQQPRYRENATLRRSGRTKHGRPVCRFKSASTHTHTHTLGKGNACICIECIVRSTGLPTPIDDSSFLSVTLWTILLSDTNGRNLLSVFEHPFSDTILSVETRLM